MARRDIPPALLDQVVTTPQLSVLLIDDQEIIAQRIQELLAGEPDITVHFCNDPTQAIRMAEAVEPTVILQDLVMPNVEGLQLVRYFRANSKTQNVPMIVLSAEEDAKVKAAAFTCGANDYLVKLPEKAELIARIRYHSYGYIRLLERNQAYKRLQESQDTLSRDVADAADYIRSILPVPIDDERISTAWKFIPSTALGGDSFGYHWLDDDHFAIYLLDVCGHGVGAALLSISVANVLRTQALPHTDFLQPDKVLQGLNQRFPMEQHRNMFLTMWYGVYDSRSRTLVYATAGHPPAILLSGPSAERVKRHRLTTQGLVVGAMPDSVYNSASVTVGKYNRLFVFSDGVYELFSPDGTSLELDKITRFMEQPDAQVSVEDVLAYARSINGPGPFPDDFSILSVAFKAKETT